MRFIYYPLPWEVTQPFGADRVCFKLDEPTELSIKRTQDECKQGFASLYKKWGLKGHNGIDISAPVGTPLLSATNGMVSHVAAKDTGFGIYCEVFTTVYDDKEKKRHYCKFRYAHLSQMKVEIGQRVRVGDLIGYTGNTGSSTGPHLHMDFKWAAENGLSLNYSNGYYGAVDFSPYLNGKSASSIRLWRQLLWK